MYSTVTIILLLLCQSVLLAQKLPSVQTTYIPIGDTVDIALLTMQTKYDYEFASFDTLGYKDRQCRTIYIANSTNKPIVYLTTRLSSDASSNNGTTHCNWEYHRYLNDTVSIMPGQILPYMNICFYPTCLEYNTGILNLIINVMGYKTIRVRAIGKIISDTLYKNNPCVRVRTEDDIVGPVLIGGEIGSTIYLRNFRYDTVKVSLSRDSINTQNSFTMAAEFPMTIPPLAEIPISVRYAPLPNTPNVFYQHIFKKRFEAVVNDIYCATLYATLTGYAIEPTADSIATPLFPDTRQVLGMYGTFSSARKTFHFINNQPNDLKIVSVSMRRGLSFRIINIQPMSAPFTLLSGERMSVEIELFDTSRGLIQDDLIINIENALTSQTFEIQGLHKELIVQSTPRVQLSDHQLSIHPNPMSESVMIRAEEMRNASIEIYNILGELVYRSIGSELNWNRLTTSGSRAPAGTYIVRVSGVSASDIHSITSSTLILE